MYSKPCVFLWEANFRGPIASFVHILTLSRLPPLEICITTCTGSVTRRGVYPCLLLPDTYFHFHVRNHATLLDFVQWYRVHQSITKHSVDSYHALTPMSCDVPMHKCNAMRHCMSIPCHIYDESYMGNLIHAYTMHLGQL